MKKKLTGVLIIFALLVISYPGVAFIPTAKQILQPILKANRETDNLNIVFKTTIFDDRYDEERIEVDEQIYIKKGGIFRSERSLAYGKEVIINYGRKSFTMVNDVSDTDYRKIDTVLPIVFFQESIEALINDLSYLGVDTGTVAFDRIDGKVTFVIGERIGQIPCSQLWTEKETGFPVRFVGIGTSNGKRVKLRAEYIDYTRVNGKIWFPNRIEFYRDDILWVVSVPVKILINEKISDSLFRIPGKESFSPGLKDFLNVRE
jgi:outer membrane lipoprotein-sorting protein